MADALYSLTLLAALAAGVIAALAGVLTLRWPSSPLRDHAVWSGVLALCAGAVSFSVHLVFGHGPAAPEPMDLGRFLRIHLVYGVVALLILVALGALLWSRRSR
jgi:uncharacterized membrane protein